MSSTGGNSGSSGLGQDLSAPLGVGAGGSGAGSNHTHAGDGSCCGGPRDAGGQGNKKTLQEVGPFYLSHMPDPMEVDLFRAARLGYVVSCNRL